jgi:hypothetical protein
MPSIRDLKGRPVDEVVASRDIPGLPDAGEQMADRAAVRAAVERLEANRLTSGEPAEPSGVHENEIVPAQPQPRLVPKAPVAEDVEGALQVLEASLEMVITLARSLADEVSVMRERIEAVRSRAERDAGRLKVLLDAIKQVDG